MKPTFEINLNELATVHAFAATDPQRAVLCGVHLCLKNNSALMVGTDGKTMMVLKVGTDADMPAEFDGITFEAASILNLVKANNVAVSSVTLELVYDYEGKTRTGLKIYVLGRAYLTIEQPLIRQPFPNWHEVIPQQEPEKAASFTLNLDYFTSVQAVMSGLIHKDILTPQVRLYPAIGPQSETSHPPMIVRPINGPLEGRAVILIMPVRDYTPDGAAGKPLPYWLRRNPEIQPDDTPHS